MSDLARPLQPLLDRFRNVRRTIRRLFVLDGLAHIAMFLCAYVVVVPLLDYALYLPQGVRVIFLAAAVGFAGYVAARRIFRPISLPISDEDLAIYVERHYPQVRHRLLAALELSRIDPEREGHFNSPELVRKLINDTAAEIGVIEPGTIVSRRAVATTGAYAILATLLVAGAATLAATQVPEHFRQGVQRLLGLNVPWPQRTFLTVDGFTDGRATVALGDPFTILIRAEGSIPGHAMLHYEFATGEIDDVRVDWDEEQSAYVHPFEAVRADFTFHVTAGRDARTDDLQVIALPRPRPVETRMVFDYPDYISPVTISQMNLPAEGEPVNADSFRGVPYHTRITLQATCNIEIDEALVTLTAGDPVDLRPAVQGRSFEQDFVVDQPFLQAAVNLTATNGLQSERGIVSYDIRGRDDEAPSVDVHDPATDESVSSHCAYPVHMTVRDDYGISAIRVQWMIPGDTTPRVNPPLAQPDIDLSYPGRTIVVRTTFDLAPLNLREGDWVVLQFVAVDNKAIEGREPNTHVTREFRLTVVSDDRLAEELQNRVDEIKRRLERVKTEQEGALRRTSRLRADLTRVDVLAAAERGMLTEIERDQQRIRRELTEARRELERVRRRGEYNRIFDESALRRLADSIALLDAVGAGEEGDAVANVLLESSHLVGEAAQVRSADQRRELLLAAEARQTAIVTTLAEVLDLLGRWISYQEIVRLVQNWIERQNQIIESIRGLNP